MGKSARRNRIKILRAERELTQRALAIRADINPTRLSFLENDLVQPTEREQKHLARALRADVVEIFPCEVQA